MSDTSFVPEHLLRPSLEFSSQHLAKVLEGRERLRHAQVCFVGLARNCATELKSNLERVIALADLCSGWRLHVETNDNTDDTDQVLMEFCGQHRQATFFSQRLGREHYGCEFAGRRTIALAEYRHACQTWVRHNADDSDYVVVIDFDARGGWERDAACTGFGWLVELQGAYGMASVSLLQMPQPLIDEKGRAFMGPAWVHYDAWAIRGIGQTNNWQDDYTAGAGGWKHHWLPPVGSDPVRLCSAFGGLAIYRTAAYLAGTYDGSTDCEHVAFHRSVADATGQSLYLNPSQRCVMGWMDAEDNQHGVRDVPKDAA